MTACSSKLQHLSYKDEVAWGENTTSMTSAQTLPITAMVDVSGLGQSFIDPGRVVQYRNERNAQILGPFAGTQFAVEFELTGHGSSTSGATSLTAAETLLAWFVGAGLVSAASGTTCSALGSVTALTTVASGTFAAGALFRAGAKNDARGDGQWGVVDSHVTTTLTSETAFAAAPTSADVVYSAANVYTVETTCAVTSKRFLIKTSDTQWMCHGAFPLSYSISGGMAGEVLKFQGTIGVSWVEPVSTTFPDTTTTAPWTYNATPNAGGGCNLQVFGTTTRNIVSARSFAINVTTGIVPLPGYNGISTHQTIVGASRTPDDIKVSLIVDAEGVSAAPTWWAAANTNAAWHCLMGYTVGDGSAVGCYLPRMRWTGRRPTQTADGDLNRVALEFVAGTDTTETTSDLSLSAMRWGFS